MNTPRYRSRLLARVIPVAVVPAIATVALLRGHYWGAAAAALLLLLLARRLFTFQARTIREVARFIDAVRFSEFNIVFKGRTGKGLPDELAPAMEEAIARFSARAREMEAGRHFYHALLDHVDPGILVVDREGKITWINKAALDLLGKPRPRSLHDLESVSPGLPALLDKLVPRETRIIPLQRENNTSRIAVTASYFILEEKKLKVISLKNIQALLDENESNAWKQVTRVLTHEIMNSLAPIISLSETFSGEEPGNDALIHAAMQTIHRRGKSLVDFVYNYKKLTRVPRPVISRFPAREWIEGIRRLFQPGDFSLACTLHPPGMYIEADRDLMEQVLINLIMNAREAVPPGKRPEVAVSVTRDEYLHPVIRVSDNGNGILPDVLDKIFVPFFTTKPNGSGIGLSICRQVINLHGGQLSVESSSDAGTCFAIRL